MNNRFFHKGLYIESLRQGKIVGIIYTAILCVWSIFAPLSAINYARMFRETDIEYTEHIRGFVFNPLFLISFTLLIPFITLLVFSFLRKRNRSDFYHSLPHKRETIYTSNILGILSWMVFGLLISGLVATVIFFFGADVVKLYFDSILPYILSNIASGIFVLGAMSIAVSLSGTVFSSISITVLILFMPRLLVATFITSLSNLVPLVGQESFSKMLYDGGNIPYQLIGEIFGYSGMDIYSFMQSWGDILYSFIVGIILLTVGGFLFKARKSEGAGMPAENPIVQTTIRVLLAFLICTLAIFMWLNNEGPLEILVTYTFALIAYFSYEVISTKSLKSLKNTIPGLVALVVLNIVFASALQLTGHSILNKSWDADKIKEIGFIKNDSYSYEMASYEDLLLEDLKLDNPDLIAATAGWLEEIQTSAKTDKNLFYQNWSNTALSIVIYEKNGSKTVRDLFVPTERASEDKSIIDNSVKLSTLIAETAVANGVYKQLPETPDSIDIPRFSESSAYSENKEKIYLSLKEEFNSFSAEEAQALSVQRFLTKYFYHESRGQYFEDWNFELFANGSVKSKAYQSQYSITYDTPKTYTLLLKYLNDNPAPKTENMWSEYFESPREFLSATDGELIVQVINFKNTTGTMTFRESNYDKYIPIAEANPELFKKLDEIVSKGKSPKDLTKPLLRISLSGAYNDQWRNYERYIEIDEALYNEFSKMNYEMNIMEQEYAPSEPDDVYEIAIAND